MSHAEHRPRIVLADLIIMVAAAALGMAVLRTTIESGIGWFPSGGWYLRHVPSPHSHWRGPLGHAAHYYVFFTLVNGVPQILIASLGVVALSLRRRSAPYLPLSRRPGFLLCLAAVTASTWSFLSGWMVVRAHGPNSQLEFCKLIAAGIFPTASFAVLGLWVGLALGGRAAPAPSRLDRIGYALAASLVFLLALDTLRMVLGRVDNKWAIRGVWEDVLAAQARQNGSELLILCP